MAHPLETHYVQQFTTNLQLLLQDEGGRLAGTTMEGDHYGKQASPVNQFGTVEASEITGRNQDIVPADVPTDRRWLDPKDFDVATRIERADDIRVVADPTSSYVRVQANAMRRKMDQVKIDCFFADAKTGETGGTTTIFPTGATSVVPDTEGASGQTGMNVDKLKAALKLLTAFEIDLENEELHCILDAKLNLDMLRQIEIIHGDYTRVAGVVVRKGFLREYMGVMFHHKENLKKVSTNTRVPLWVKSRVHFGKWPKEIDVDIDKLKTKRGHPKQIYTCMTFNATRTEEKGVIEILCKTA